MSHMPEHCGKPLRDAYDHLRNGWIAHGELDLAQRRSTFKAVRNVLVTHAEKFASALNADFAGRSRHESLLAEVALCISAIDYAVTRIAGWSKPRRLALEWPHWTASARVLKQARGVAGVIGASNYPLQLVLMPLISALSAGCRALLKPSEAAPQTAELLRSTLANAVEPALVSVVCGGPDTSAALAALPLDILLFTGSNAVGRKVAAAAAANLTPVILELGGKSAVIVDASAQFASTADSIIRGKLINGGQTCVAPDYVLVPHQAMDRLVTQLRAAASLLYPTPSTGDYTAILSDSDFARLARLESGHRVMPLFTQRLERPFYDPKLLIAPSLSSEVMQHEIFGPLLPIIPYRELDEALAIVRALPPPLVLYWFGRSSERLHQVLQNTTSATVSVNETVIHAGISAIPLGGIGLSGMGRYHGRAGFDAFTHERVIYKQARYSLTNLARPPYGKRASAILKLLIR